MNNTDPNLTSNKMSVSHRCVQTHIQFGNYLCFWNKQTISNGFMFLPYVFAICFSSKVRISLTINQPNICVYMLFPNHPFTEKLSLLRFPTLVLLYLHMNQLWKYTMKCKPLHEKSQATIILPLLIVMIFLI